MRAGSPASSPGTPPGAGSPPRPAAPALRGPTVPVTRGSRRADGGLRPGWEAERGVETKDPAPRPAQRAACVWSTPSPRGEARPPGPERSRRAPPAKGRRSVRDPPQGEGSAGAAGSSPAAETTASAQLHWRREVHLCPGCPRELGGILLGAFSSARFEDCKRRD